MVRTFYVAALMSTMLIGGSAFAQDAAQRHGASNDARQAPAQQSNSTSSQTPNAQVQNRTPGTGDTSNSSGGTANNVEVQPGQQTTGQAATAPSTNAQVENRRSNSSATPQAGHASESTATSAQANQPGSVTRVHYVTQNAPDIWRASKLDGVDIYNEQNEKIGDISDVLIDRSGKVQAVVIGVGGFLGLGERNVAVSFDSLQWQIQNNDQANSSSSNVAAGRTTTGSTANANNNSTVRDYPAKAVLPGATKDQLKNAPEFKYAS